MESTTRFGILLFNDEEALAAEAARAIAGAVRSKPDLFFCVATGASPRRTYELLAREAERNPRLFDRLRILKLDEWGGLAMDDPATCETYVRKLLVEPLGISEDRCDGFRSDAEDPRAECERVQDLLLRKGPIDLAILGLGADGHIAMNFPGEELDAYAHIAEIRDGRGAHPMLADARGEVRYGLTLGMTEIVQAKEVFLIATGASKSDAVRRLLEEGISTWLPASFLWMCRRVTCYFDFAAASKIRS
ncbi:MAG: 6-phosphogluconolactonase [Planctomycetes bacterium]|nr:6-phosphogluconolactonase [Planctomycetota bacterium]